MAAITAAPTGLDLKNMKTAELVRRHAVAKKKCAQPIERRDDEGSVVDYLPAVAVWNLLKDTSAEDSAANKQYVQDLANRKAWCKIADDAAAELGERSAADVAASVKTAQSAAFRSKKPRRKKPEAAADAEVFEDITGITPLPTPKRSPIYWLGLGAAALTVGGGLFVALRRGMK